jgi:tetratricopeptide (TPR) repeat protein
MTERKAIWDLIKEKDFENACFQADEEYLVSNNILALRNKIYALLNLGRFQNVIELENKIIKLRNGETDSDFIFLAIAFCCLNEFNHAIETLKKGEKAIYTDAAGGFDIILFQYFIGVKTKNETIISRCKKKIKSLLRKRASINFPGNIGRYLLDEISVKDLLSEVADIDTLKERNLCKINFYIGVKALENENTEIYMLQIKECLKYDHKAFLEYSYYLAKFETQYSR